MYIYKYLGLGITLVMIEYKARVMHGEGQHRILGHHQIRHLEMIYKLKLLGEMLVFSRYSELNCQEESKHIMCLYMVESTLLIQSLSDSFYVMYFALSKCYQLNCRRSKPPTNY